MQLINLYIIKCYWAFVSTNCENFKILLYFQMSLRSSTLPFLSSKSVQQRFHFLVWLKENPTDRSFLFCTKRYLRPVSVSWREKKSLKSPDEQVVSFFTQDTTYPLAQGFVSMLIGHVKKESFLKIVSAITYFPSPLLCEFAVL